VNGWLLGAVLALWIAVVWALLAWVVRGRRAPRARKIVVFADGIADGEADRIVRSMGGRVVRRLPLVNAAVCDLADAAAFVALSAHQQVTRVDEDLPVHAYPCLWCRPEPASAPQPPETVPWGVARIGAPSAWKETPPNLGAGLEVGVLDTGVDLAHPDLSPNLAAGVNFVDPRRPPADDNGHGTHVTGTLAAALNGIGVVGVAPKVRLRPVKVLDKEGSGSLSGIVQGLDWCVRRGIRLVNLSLGSPEGNTTFAEAVARAAEAGVVLVAAAGNAGPGPDTLGYPARYPQVIAVGATTAADAVAEYSSRGAELAVVAPGDAIPSTWPGGQYRELSGTSMATPHVTGLAALLLAAEPGLTPVQVKERLKVAARPLPGLAPHDQGTGLVDAGRTLGRQASPDGGSVAQEAQ
jgi:subtilisin